MYGSPSPPNGGHPLVVGNLGGGLKHIFLNTLLFFHELVQPPNRIKSVNKMNHTQDCRVRFELRAPTTPFQFLVGGPVRRLRMI